MPQSLLLLTYKLTYEYDKEEDGCHEEEERSIGIDDVYMYKETVWGIGVVLNVHFKRELRCFFSVFAACLILMTLLPKYYCLVYGAFDGVRCWITW
jgi:hypothetical protein